MSLIHYNSEFTIGKCSTFYRMIKLVNNYPSNVICDINS